MKAVVVMPTYNERGGIAAALDAVLAVHCALRVLVVDDNSPDGTGEVVQQLAKGEPRVVLLLRPAKLGLGSAYREGFSYAFKHMGADILLEMDSDFSHDPADIPRLMESVDSADLVIGSRYVAGGRIEGWSMRRHVLSRLVNLSSRMSLGFGVHDYTSGFRCYRAEALIAAGYLQSRCVGYAFQIEMTARFLEAGLRVKEVPIVFRERRHGSSKMSREIAIEAAFLLGRLAARRVLKPLRLSRVRSSAGGERQRST